jgi:hypothetical protein
MSLVCSLVSRPGSYHQPFSVEHNVIGQYDLAFKCGTDRDDETTVWSHSFFRHTPSSALINDILDTGLYTGILLAFWIQNLTFRKWIELPVIYLFALFSGNGCARPWFHLIQRRLTCANHSSWSSKRRSTLSLNSPPRSSNCHCDLELVLFPPASNPTAMPRDVLITTGLLQHQEGYAQIKRRLR